MRAPAAARHILTCMISCLSDGRIQFIDTFGFQRATLARENDIWAGLHRLQISPRSVPSKKAKLCAYLRCFSRPERCFGEPYYDLPFPSRSSDLFFILGWARMLCQLSRAGLTGQPCQGICADAPSAPHGLLGMSGNAHCLCDCPRFGDLRSEHAQLFHDALYSAMRSLMWHKNQKSVCAMILAIVNEAET